ncbi:MAG: BTAD domain-containing putative transcriptional regulator, partial [Chloroflexota bacterium]
MPDLRLYVFGSPQLTSDNTELILNTRKALALLTYLVVTNRPQSRDTLATMFWSETSQKQGRAYLRRALWTIKKSIGDAPLTIEGQLIQFNPESGLWLDVTEFRRLLNGCDKHRERPLLDCSTCLSQMETAAALYRDDFLAGFTLTDCPAFDDWQFFEAEQFRQTLATTLSQLLRGHSQQENYEAAIQHAQRWVTLDPLHEPAQQALMQLYHQNGQAAAALRQYKLWVQLLDDELGLPPSEATVTLYEAIQANRNLTPFVSYRPQIDDHEEKGEGNEPSRPSLASSKAQHHLPVSISPLLGRDEERSQLVSFLKTPDQRLVTLIGPGGMGKTHLALSVAETVKDQFSGGVHFVPLAPLQSTEPIISTIAETLGYQFYGSDPSIEQLLAYFADKELLLILDNFEHLLSASSLVIEVLQAAPRIKILVTSRERLNVQDETILVLAGMVYPDIANHTPSTDLAEYDALLLLQRQAKLVQADFAFNDKTLSEAIRICQLVQGVPLAIVLAIGWLEVLSLRDIRIEIERSLDFLETDLRDVPDRQRSIRAVFDGSWEQLSDRAQNIFMKLSIFRGGFTREAAEAIAGAGLRELRTLVNKTFVVYQQNKRYEIHELLRQYGYEKLIASGQENNIRQDHSTYFLEFMAQREIDFRGRAQLEAVPPVKANIENIRLAWDWALAQKQEAAIAKAVEGLHLYFATSGLMVAGVAFLDTGLQSLSPKKEPTSSLAWAKILIRSSFMRANTDIDFADLTADIEQCLQIAQQHQDEAEIAFCMHVQAFYIFAYKHDAARAIKLAEKALARFRALDDRFYVVRMLPFLAKYSNLLSDTDAMAAYYSETLELATQIN